MTKLVACTWLLMIALPFSAMTRNWSVVVASDDGRNEVGELNSLANTDRLNRPYTTKRGVGGEGACNVCTGRVTGEGAGGMKTAGRNVGANNGPPLASHPPSFHLAVFIPRTKANPVTKSPSTRNRAKTVLLGVGAAAAVSTSAATFRC